MEDWRLHAHRALGLGGDLAGAGLALGHMEARTTVLTSRGIDLLSLAERERRYEQHLAPEGFSAASLAALLNRRYRTGERTVAARRA